MSVINSESKQDGVVLLTLDRPPVNALDIETCRAVEAAFKETVAGGAKAIAFTGAGEKCFSAGVDIRKAADYTDADKQEMCHAINGMYREMYAAPVPVVSAVNGHALAGGFVFMLASDVVVATDKPCNLGLAEVRAGVPFPIVPLILAREALDPTLNRQLALTGRNLSPQEAHEKGIVDEVVAADALVDRAVEIAADLATLEAFPKIKDQTRAAIVAEIDAGIPKDPMLNGWF